jgi:hypothetical protein
MERARSMRLHASFPLQLWADAVDIVVYLIVQQQEQQVPQTPASVVRISTRLSIPLE